MGAFWLAVLAAGIWGVTSVIEKIVLVRTEPVPGLFYRCVGVLLGIFVLVAFMLKPSQIREVDPRSALLLITSGFFGSFVAFIAFYKALKLGEASLVVPISGSFYLIAFIAGIVFLGESVSLLKVAAVLLITLGLWMLRTTVGVG